ncbi:transcriptional regulator, AraC family [Filimonas lacunae]|uniref:Transcriptional regulator, AraC family n=1 Tax=Filimonas lacunae TaxID=477680 RepID=A0A173MB13_9BACT|nr:helix-turn-helix transcriptional regulator [Filimonas lacunae]BAV04753.1 transcriptional regulator, AraC family [Filimonas lacunae]SIT32174.1 transcriptional regulator, AraC family [Filimonas lacunae]
MQYREIIPGKRLQPYVKCYYVYEHSGTGVFEDTVFPNGCMEIIFNLGSGQWQTAGDNGFVTNPAVELWGQIVKPLPVKSIGSNTMLGIRFFSHAAACFLDEKVDAFNNQVVDYREAAGNAVEVNHLYHQLLDARSWGQRIVLIEHFLHAKLDAVNVGLNRLLVVNDVMKELRQPDFFDNIDNVASRYGITSRYLQKLFVQYTGLTPKLYSKIHRFQNSLRLIGQSDVSLTSIAYDCGYFDQSHFIREFKSFTGLTPSGYALESSPLTTAISV